jgi:hypothetical protein
MDTAARQTTPASFVSFEWFIESLLFRYATLWRL